MQNIIEEYKLCFDSYSGYGFFNRIYLLFIQWRRRVRLYSKMGFAQRVMVLQWRIDIIDNQTKKRGG